MSNLCHIHTELENFKEVLCHAPAATGYEVIVLGHLVAARFNI
jgi:hypothetical protein